MREIKKLTLIGITLVLTLSVALSSPVKAQSTDVLYFEETGHSITGVILEYYQSVEDAMLLFGFPITEEFTDENDGQRTQYFQHMRLDITSGKDGPSVKIAPLGKLLYDENAAATPLNTMNTACRTSAATGKQVCYDFLRFYEAHNGAKYLGDPISNLIEQNGRIVQYFENARLEWRPELPAGQKIGVSNLGQIYYNLRVGSNGLDTTGRNIILSSIPEVKANTFVSKALIPANSSQQVFVVVRDKNLKPVQGAMITINIHKPGELGDAYRAPVTDENGISIFEFNVGNLPVKQVVNVDVKVDYSGTSTQSESWFRIWW